jgi:hypothetical protein
VIPKAGVSQLTLAGRGLLGRLLRGVIRKPALYAGAVLVGVNAVAISGLWRPGEEVLAGISTTVAAFLAFLVSGVPSFRLWRVTQHYADEARQRPRDLVQTASNVIGEVVGRDELCHLLVENPQNRGTRIPHVVIGGVGMGKTSLLVRLTELLAERGAVPVPIRLREAQDRLDFRELARQRFLAEAEAGLLSALLH